MLVYPAIDLRGGKCVRLQQGRADAQTVYGDEPAAVAREFRTAGAEWVHVVDLDGAFRGSPANTAAVEAVLAAGLQVELGGGLRDEETVRRILATGVARGVIGTRAVEDPAFVTSLIAEHGERIAVGIDARDGHVAVRGWVETTGVRALDLAREMEALGVRTLIYTDIATDGMLTGPNLSALESLLGAVRCNVIASGGVANLDHISALKALADRFAHLHGVITGKALYEKSLDLGEAIKVAAG